MERDSLIFYRSFYESINGLPDEDQVKVYKAIFEYSLNFNEIELSGIPKAIFTLIKPQLDANNKKYINGLKGGRKANNNQKETKTEPKQNQKETKVEANVNDNDNENKNDNVNDNKSDTPIYKIKIEEATPENYNEHQRIAIKFFWLFANYEKNKTFKDDISVVAKKAKLEAWTKEVKSLMESKGYTAKDFYKVFQYLPKDDFWMNTISSISALNKIDKNGNLRFATILIKANDWMMKPK
jgi:hypothetical protein